MNRRPVTEPLEARRLLTYVMLDYHVATGGGDMGAQYGPGIDTWSDTASTPYELEGNPDSGYTHIAYKWSAGPDLFGPRVNNPTAEWLVRVNGQQVYHEAQSDWDDISIYTGNPNPEYVVGGPPTVSAEPGATATEYIKATSGSPGTINASLVFGSVNWANEFGTDSNGNPMNGIGHTVDYVELGIHTANIAILQVRDLPDDGTTELSPGVYYAGERLEVDVYVYDDFGYPVSTTVVPKSGSYDSYVVDPGSAPTDSLGVATITVDLLAPGDATFTLFTDKGGERAVPLQAQTRDLDLEYSDPNANGASNLNPLLIPAGGIKTFRSIRVLENGIPTTANLVLMTPPTTPPAAGITATFNQIGNGNYNAIINVDASVLPGAYVINVTTHEDPAATIFIFIEV